jgi:peptidoglycan hydrolase-like protein with peptidoglycan-binding domain
MTVLFTLSIGVILALSVLTACSSDGTDSSGDAQDAAPSSEDDTSTSASTATTVAPETTTTTAPTTTTEPPPRVELEPTERGDDGPEVAKLQEYLNEIGFTVGAVDGDFGRRTERAVTAFQMVNGLDQTGAVDRATIEVLGYYEYDGLVLEAGAEGPEVEQLQELLAAGPFDPGVADGEFGGRTVQAVWALEKLSGIPVDGNWGPADAWAYDELMAGKLADPVVQHDQRWVEVDLSDQLVKVYDPGSTTPVLISHMSSGNGIPWANENHSGSSITPTGDFHIYRRISGWRESSLDIGRLYNPLYFVGGIAFHGATSVPLYPASHGCVRLPMHIAEYLPGELPNGTPVHVGA